MGDLCFELSAYILGALEARDRHRFLDHLSQCQACAAGANGRAVFLDSLPQSLSPIAPDPRLKPTVLDLCEAPRLPIDRAAIDWKDVVPGIRIHSLEEDAVRGMTSCLVWAEPKARHPYHEHLGDETILVLEGVIRDERGVYGPGQICRSRSGSRHTEEALVECLCYVVYYGGIRFIVPEDGP